MKKKILLSFIMMICLFIVTGCGTSKSDVESVQKNEEQEVQDMTVTEETIETESVTDEELKYDTPETTPSEDSTETVTVYPLPVTINMEQLDNCKVAVSLKEGDVYVDDVGVMRMNVKVYVYDLYDMVDVAQLEEGDTINIRKEDVLVTALERNDTGLLRINGGQDNGGFDLFTDENGTFFEIGYSDVKSYYEIGEAELPVSTEFRLFDSSDLDKGEVVFYPGDFIEADSDIVYYFNPNNTSILIEDGQVTAMYRVYTP